ncbi:MAG: hypothetical protein AAFU85_10740 [Planctomycetota bacterium]
MARIGIVSGIALCVLTALALVVSLDKSPLKFVPMMLGIPILFFGVVALNPHRRRHAIGTSAVVGTIGLLIGFGQAVRLFSLWHRTESVNLQSVRLVALMITICVVFLAAYGWDWNDRTRSLETATKRGN